MSCLRIVISHIIHTHKISYEKLYIVFLLRIRQYQNFKSNTNNMTKDRLRLRLYRARLVTFVTWRKKTKARDDMSRTLRAK
jgi:hypothetical protein